MKPKINKRGDVSIVLLVIGVFAICALAIISFLLHLRIKEGNFADIETFENLSSQAEDFYFYVNSGLSPEEAAERIGAEMQGNILALNAEQKEAARLSFITKKEPTVILSVKYRVDLSR
jgi:hypothetical protein